MHFYTLYAFLFAYFYSINPANMPSPISVNIYCPKQKLISFARFLYGPPPFQLKKRDNFSKLLNFLLAPAPDDYKPENYGPNTFQVQLPFYEDKNVLKHYYLSPVSQAIIIRRFNDMFELTFREHVDKCLLSGLRQNEAIYSFIEKYQLSVDVVSDLKKDYQRYRGILRQRDFYKRNRKKTSKIMSV